MQMNMLTAQTYVSDHQARLLADARRSQLTRGRRTLRQLLGRTRRPSRPVHAQPILAPASAG